MSEGRRVAKCPYCGERFCPEEGSPLCGCYETRRCVMCTGLFGEEFMGESEKGWLCHNCMDLEYPKWDEGGE